VLSTVGHCEERLVVAGDESLIGSIGVLAIATRGVHGPGEVILRVRGGSEAYLAWSAEPIPRGATVLVINDRGTRAVDVSAWVDPLQPPPGDLV
jgi:predicted nucleotidyltransferase